MPMSDPWKEHFMKRAMKMCMFRESTLGPWRTKVVKWPGAPYDDDFKT